MSISDKMNTPCFNWYLLSKYRTELMGIATILVLLCHARPNGVVLPDLVLTIMGLGQFGVQVFLFLSGIGIYYSLNSSKQNVKLITWYKKRFVRLFLPYLIICGPILVISLFDQDVTVQYILLRLSTIGYWTGEKGVAWFVAALVPFYLISPLINKLLILGKYKRNIIFLCLFFSPAIVLNMIPQNMAEGNISVAHFMQTIIVFPSFILGFYLAPCVAKKQLLSYKAVVMFVVSLIMLFLLTLYMTGLKSYWLFILLALGLVCKVLEYSPLLSSVLLFIGTISLESYLFNVSLPEVYIGKGNLYYISLIVLGTFLAFIANKLSSKIIAK